MKAFNHKDHVVVTITGTGEKKYLLNAQVKSIAPVDPGQADGPSFIDVLNEDGLEHTRHHVEESAAALAAILNGEPDATMRDTLAQQVIQTRQETARVSIEYLDRQHQQHDTLSQTLNGLIDSTGAKAQRADKIIEAFAADKKKSFRLRMVDHLYRTSQAEILPAQEDGMVLRLLGWGLLDRVKENAAAVEEAEKARTLQKRYSEGLATHKASREASYQQSRARLERQMNDPQLQDADRARLAGVIRDYAQDHGPALDFRFMRDERTGAFRPLCDINDELRQERLDQIRDIAARARGRRNPASADEERQQDLSIDRLRRRRDRDFGHER